MSGPVAEQVQVPGATLWTTSRGTGVPVVLCHGGPGLSDNLAPVAEMVEDLALVHRYDQRGSGRSRCDGLVDVPALVADLDALRQHWGHHRWFVGGHSWGANLALLFALAQPDNTLGVIYLAGSGLTRDFEDQVRDIRLARLSDDERVEMAQLAGLLSGGDPVVIERFLRLVWITDFADRQTAVRVLDERPLYAFARNEDVFRSVAASFEAITGDGLAERVREMSVPMIVIHGAHDVPARARPIADAAPNSQWIELAHSAHVPWFEEPLVLRDVLRGFIKNNG